MLNPILSNSCFGVDKPFTNKIKTLSSGPNHNPGSSLTYEFIHHVLPVFEVDEKHFTYKRMSPSVLRRYRSLFYIRPISTNYLVFIQRSRPLKNHLHKNDVTVDLGVDTCEPLSITCPLLGLFS